MAGRSLIIRTNRISFPQRDGAATAGRRRCTLAATRHGAAGLSAGGPSKCLCVCYQPRTRIMQLAAQWILPIAQPPLEDGVIAVRDGSIESVGFRGEFPEVDVEELGQVILMPGLINAHAHLELGHLRGVIERARDLPEWLERLVASQSDLDADRLGEQTAAAVQSGAGESLRAGVTTVGDISRLGDITRPLLRDGPLRVVSFGEVLGIGRGRHQLDERLRLAADPRFQSDHLITALSPHAPYSIDAAGIEQVVAHARQHDMRTCIHLAESIEEIQFLQTGRGRFREMLERLGVWDDAIAIPKATPVRYLFELGALGPECLIAHGNYLDEEEIDLLCATGTSVAYCPRTHTYFGHQRHPIVELMGGGVNVCVGTDSLASNPSLSVLEELACVHRQHPELPVDAVLALGTINAARALGLAREVGTLEPGKQADLAVFRCPGDGAELPEEALLTTPAVLERLYIAGARVEL